MKTTKIKIKNFKSIKDEIFLEVKNIDNKNCCILLGINESGKSNILEAISLLSDEQGMNHKLYCNNQAQENEEDDISIVYEQQCDKQDDFEKELIKIGIHRYLATTIKITMFRREVLINSKDEKHVTNTCSYEVDQKELTGYVVNYQDGKIELETDDNYVDDDFGNTNCLDRKQLSKFIKDRSEYIIKDRFPKIIFWKPFEEKYLIAETCSLASFMSDPDISIPLKNCFRIAEIENIQERISLAMSDDAQNSELSSKLSKKITEHINEVWKEHKINIDFVINGDQLSFLVNEKDSYRKYKFYQRSDGFKHFVSILLNLSAENKTGQLKNNIILLDEPEAHLHPSGQKFLRNELLRISENNLVIFATHSIFMVDKKNLDRHFSVKKSNEITCLSSTKKSNLFAEEVLYKALGTSILEHINENVLILEGKTDSDIFNLYKENFENEIALPNLSLIPADGGSNIKKYTKFFNTNLIKGFVVTDSDDEGIAAKNAALNEKGYNKANVFEINEILNTNKASTLEDLFDCKYITESASAVYNVPVMELITSKPFLNQIYHKLNKTKLKDKNKKREFKKAFVNNISKLNEEDLMKQKYFKFFKKLQKKLIDAPAN